jgi:negative regulator of flagellin synthesis FlgM
MTIERLGPIDPIHKFNQAEKQQKAQPKSDKDSISFSEEAKMKAEVYRASEQVNAASDVRADRVAEVKQKLEDPSYIDDKVLNSVAERLMEMFDL